MIMRTCGQCDDPIPSKVVIDGKERNLQNRKYCLTCSPFGSGNRKRLGQAPAKSNRSGGGKFVRWQRKARRERKEKLVAMLGGQCMGEGCNYSRCIAALDFHHRDPNTKSFSMGSQGILRRWDMVKAEAEKCDLLCKNCHAEFHYEDR